MTGFEQDDPACFQGPDKNLEAALRDDLVIFSQKQIHVNAVFIQQPDNLADVEIQSTETHPAPVDAEPLRGAFHVPVGKPQQALINDLMAVEEINEAEEGGRPEHGTLKEALHPTGISGHAIPEICFNAIGRHQQHLVDLAREGLDERKGKLAAHAESHHGEASDVPLQQEIPDQLRQKTFLQGRFSFWQLAFAVEEKIKGEEAAGGPQGLGHGGKMAAVLPVAMKRQDNPLPLSEALIMQSGFFYFNERHAVLFFSPWPIAHGLNC